MASTPLSQTSLAQCQRFAQSDFDSAQLDIFEGNPGLPPRQHSLPGWINMLSHLTCIIPLAVRKILIALLSAM